MSVTVHEPTVAPKPATRPATTRPELDAVLREVNRIRTERGGDPIYDLPKGTRWYRNSCPLARSLADVGCEGVYQYISWSHFGCDDFDVVDTPAVMFEFAKAFDRKEYPELIA